MGKSFPQIGNQRTVEAVKTIVFIVEGGMYTKDELLEEMEHRNADSDSKLFKDKGAFLDFTLENSGSSLEIIREIEDGTIELTEDGKKLIEENFQLAAFELFERKSTTNFTHFYTILETIDKEYVGQRNYVFGDKLQDIITAFYSATGNQFASQTSAGILRDFGIIEEDDNGRWIIDQQQYARLRGNPEELIINVLQENDYKMSKDELIRIIVDDWRWSSDKIEGLLDDLKRENKIYFDRSEGVNWVVLSS